MARRRTSKRVASQVVGTKPRPAKNARRDLSAGVGLRSSLTWLVLWVAPGFVAALMLGMNAWTLEAHREAMSWVEVPCRIGSNRFERAGKNDSALALQYEYEFRGVRYSNDRLDLLPGRTGTDARWERELAERLPLGSTTVCYVNPADPSYSVLDRDRVLINSRTLRLLAMPLLLAAIAFFTVHAYHVVQSFSFGRQELELARNDKSDGDPMPVTAASLGAAPRRIGFATSLALLVGRPKQMFGVWLALVICWMLFCILDGPSVFSGWGEWTAEREEAEGTVHRMTATPNREWTFTVYEVTYDYQVAGHTHPGFSYVRGRQFEPGDTIDVLYDPAAPSNSLLSQGRKSDVPAFLPLLFLGGSLLIVAGMLLAVAQGLHAARFLRTGLAATARFVVEEDRRVYRFSDGLDEHDIAFAGEVLPDREVQELIVLYNPHQPDRNIVYDVVCIALPTTSDGSLPQVTIRQLVPRLLVPLAAIGLMAFIWWMTLPG